MVRSSSSTPNQGWNYNQLTCSFCSILLWKNSDTFLRPPPVLLYTYQLLHAQTKIFIENSSKHEKLKHHPLNIIGLQRGLYLLWEGYGGSIGTQPIREGYIVPRGRTEPIAWPDWPTRWWFQCCGPISIFSFICSTSSWAAGQLYFS